MHRRFRIGLPKIHRWFRIGPPKIHRRFRIGPSPVTLNLLLPEFHSRWILVYHGYYVRKATELLIWNRMKNIAQLIEQYWWVKFQYYRMYRIFKHKLCHALGVIHTQKSPDREDGQTFWVINITTKLMVLPEKAIKGLGQRLVKVCPHSKPYLLCYWLIGWITHPLWKYLYSAPRPNGWCWCFQS